MSGSAGNNDNTSPLPEIAGYRLHKVINHGGMSTVYLGNQLALAREVAIKVMLPLALADEVSRRRFENEVRTIARLEHPNIVGIHEVGRTFDGLPYYAMPYLPRGHLGQRELSKDEPRAIEIALTLLQALDYAHARGVVHRDVKAENVLFDESERVLLADFGIALRRGFGPRVTTAGLAVGSTAYMAPEQARGEDVDGRADLYSMGVLLWEMLTGRLPFEAADALSMAVMHAQDPIPKLPQHLRHWQRFMNRALSKQAAHRFQDATQMANAIRGVQQRKPWTGAVESLRRLRPTQRWAMPVWATLGVTAVTLVVLAFSLGRDEAEKPAPMTPIATAPQATPSVDPTAAMLQPLPEAPLQHALEDARQQIARGRLTEPEDANAFDSVLLAWHTDSTHPDVAKAIDQLTAAFSDHLVRAVKDGKDDRARELASRAAALGQQTGTANSAAQQQLREATGKALDARLQKAVTRRDAADAQRLTALAEQLQMPRKLDPRLIAQAKALPKGLARGSKIETASLSSAKVSVALTPRPVSRREYARFAAANGREPALCRERASLLRVLDPRDWQSPGFRQDENDPVVCISLEDAQAYAHWYSAQTGRRYRLPSAEEIAQTGVEIDGRAVSLWLRDCGQNCQQRQVSGGSWRSHEGQRTLAAARGYDDVGFRLVRER
ncbi:MULTISPECIES: bifunctional serine/threonine-protein kinase/formylglycine-generating enzyme family protein [unclassified Lysobacter]|uniref:bifunctional serine/threonine-protein kinase/formylglycine-generating enzyme family protein n=1 Tax=unclassified Lysobacter TaxID=2635362 RepID=UPI001C2286B3|nr:bifunctional serine/threonine-protein kinase/formylglycine-generating enzyme family protein [Lysobacter sp. MMG2]MBU8975079.1 protein kinase [Lysobacter sp. MMG2]